MNKAILVGRLTRDPETRTIQSGQVTTSFTIAVDRNFKNKNGEKEADFIPIVVWNKLAELCARYLFKGSRVAIIGRIQVRTYTAQDGSRRYATEIVADEVEFLSTKAETAGARTASSAGAPPPPSYEDSFGVPMDGFEEIDDLDVPF